MSSERNKCLGDKLTDEQYEDIASGQFKLIQQGDYWIIDGIKWEVDSVDPLYYYTATITQTNNLHQLSVNWEIDNEYSNETN